MTTTPTIWKAKFSVNLGSTTGEQMVPQSIGLANGNILIVWEDDTGGSSPGRDIMGRIFDPLGNPIGTGPFQINYTFTNSDEVAPQIVALPDGGFVAAYGSFNDGVGGDFIAVERFGSNGAETAYNLITDQNGGLNNFYQAKVTADNNGNYIVAFERDVGGGDLDVEAYVYNYLSNQPLPNNTSHGFSVAQNSADPDFLGNIATFSDGNVITIYNEPDAPSGIGSGYQSAEFYIWQSASGNTVWGPVEFAGEVATDAIAQDVAVLTGGQFVLLYKATGLSYNIGLRIGASDTPGSALGPVIVVAPLNHIAGNYEARVVALNDGGFLVVWADPVNDALKGTRYNAAGDVIGIQNFQVATGIGSNPILGRLHLTSDGRVLVPFENSSGEISEVILDPRENIIHGTSASEVLTTQINSTQLFGEGGDDTLYGLGGADTLDGGSGVDILQGGAGDDTYILQDLHRADPILNLFVYDGVVEGPGGGNDTVQVAHVSGSNVSNYRLGPNIENGIVIGTDAFSLTGNGLNNKLTGNSASNGLDGAAGNDLLIGGLGTNTINGGAGWDRSQYAITAASVTLTHNADGSWTIANAGISDTITNVEVAQFTDTNVALRRRAANDFAATNISDILFRNDATGDIWFEAISNGAFAGWNQIGGSDTHYAVIGIGDFFGNGTDDILCRNNSTGDTWFAQMSNGAFAGWNQIGGSDTHYSIVGVADFYGRGTDDILFRNNSSGDTWIEAMSNGAFAGWHQIGGSDTTYAAVGLGDFFGNGTDDVLFRNNSTGDTWVEAISNGTFNGWQQIGGSDAHYSVAGVGDFFGNGTDDILFRNNSTGDTWFAAISNGAFNGWHQVGGSDTKYAIVAVGDYFGNGAGDILFRNNSTGDTWFEAMSNGSFNGWQQVGGSSTSYTVKT
jgi:hypothetical protein